MIGLKNKGFSHKRLPGNLVAIKSFYRFMDSSRRYLEIDPAGSCRSWNKRYQAAKSFKSGKRFQSWNSPIWERMKANVMRFMESRLNSLVCSVSGVNPQNEVSTTASVKDPKRLLHTHHVIGSSWTFLITFKRGKVQTGFHTKNLM